MNIFVWILGIAVLGLIGMLFLWIGCSVVILGIKIRAYLGLWSEGVWEEILASEQDELLLNRARGIVLDKMEER